MLYRHPEQDYPTSFVVAQDGSGDYTSVQEAVSNCKVLGNDFRAENLTIENRAGQVGQAAEYN